MRVRRREVLNQTQRETLQRLNIYQETFTSEAAVDKKPYSYFMGQIESLDPSMLGRTEKAFLSASNKLEGRLKRALPRNKRAALRSYLDAIFKDDDDRKFTYNLTHSEIFPYIKRSRLRGAVDGTHRAFLDLKKKIKKGVRIKYQMLTERAGTGTVVDDGLRHYRSAERWFANKLDTWRSNYHSMPGQKKFIAGATLIAGLVYVLGSQSKEAVQAKNMMKKAFFVMAGYIGINTTTQVFAGKTLSEMFFGYMGSKSDKAKFYKEAFGVSKPNDHAAIRLGIIHLGPKKFIKETDRFLWKKRDYELKLGRHVPHNQRTLNIVSPSQMSPQQQYNFFRILDERYDFAALLKNIKDLKKRGVLRRDPTILDMTTALVASRTMATVRRNSNGALRLDYRARGIDIGLDELPMNPRKKWWESLPGDVDWRVVLIPRTDIMKHIKANRIRENMRKIARLHVDDRSMVDKYIKRGIGPRYRAGFEKANKKHQERGHSATFTVHEDDKGYYVMSQVKINYRGYPGQSSKAKVKAVDAAVAQGYRKMKEKYGAWVNGRTLQPVGGIFIGNREIQQRERLREGVSIYYNVMMRGAKGLERSARNDGVILNDMMDASNRKSKEIVTASKPLTKALFKKICSVNRFEGAYESFLARFGLTDNPSEAKYVKNILAYYSTLFAGKISYKNLVLYLSSKKIKSAEHRILQKMLVKIPNRPGWNARMIDFETYNRGLVPGAHRAEILSTLMPLIFLARSGDTGALRILYSINTLMPTTPRKIIFVEKATTSTFRLVPKHLTNYTYYIGRIKEPAWSNWKKVYAKLKAKIKANY